VIRNGRAWFGLDEVVVGDVDTDRCDCKREQCLFTPYCVCQASKKMGMPWQLRCG